MNTTKGRFSNQEYINEIEQEINTLKIDFMKQSNKETIIIEGKIYNIFKDRNTTSLYANGPYENERIDEIKSIDGVEFKNIDRLLLNINSLKSLNGADFKNVLHLNADENEIESINEVDFKNIKILGLANNKIKSLVGVDFKNVDVLSIENNQIESLVGVDFKNITELFITSNKIKSLVGVNLGKIRIFEIDEESKKIFKRFKSI